MAAMVELMHNYAASAANGNWTRRESIYVANCPKILAYENPAFTEVCNKPPALPNY